MQPDRLIVNTIPKSGTYLLVGLLEALGLVRQDLHLLDGHYAAGRQDDGSVLTVAVGVPDSIEALRAGRFCPAHLAWTPAVESRLRDEGIRMLFLHRDPRDLPISYERFVMSADYRRQSPQNADYQDLLAAIGGPRRRVEHLIRTNMALFPLIEYAPWLHSDAALTVRFEDLYPEVRALQSGLVGPTLKRILGYVGLRELPCQAPELFARAHGTGPTFIPGAGKVGRFRSLYDEALWELTDSAFYRMLLALYGYPANAARPVS